MSTVYEIKLISAHSDYSAFPVVPTEKRYLFKSLEKAEEMIAQYAQKENPNTHFCIILNEYKEGEHNEWIDSVVYTRAETNYARHIKRGEIRNIFEYGDLVEYFDSGVINLGIVYDFNTLISKEGEVHFSSLAIIEPRKKIPEEVVGKLQNLLVKHTKKMKVGEKERAYFDTYLSHCHCYKGEEELPEELEGELEQLVWKAEKAIASYPDSLLANSTQEWHDKEIGNYFLRWFGDKFTGSEGWLSQIWGTIASKAKIVEVKIK